MKVSVIEKVKNKQEHEVIARARIKYKDSDIDTNIPLSVSDIKKIYGIRTIKKRIGKGVRKRKLKI